MRSIAGLGGLGLALMLAACAAKPLAVPAASPPLTVPTATPPAGMSISVIPTGAMTQSASAAFEGGETKDIRTFVIGAVLLRHPQGDLLFDTGFGPDFSDQTHPLMRWKAEPTRTTGVGDQLRKAGIDPASLKAVVLTHAHYDHAGGLVDIPKSVPVWVTPAERKFIDDGGALSEVARIFDDGRYQPPPRLGGAYLGFNASYDVFGDGSVVLVEAPSHTPGSVIAFITLPDGSRYALIGDVAWQTEGVERPSQKSWLLRTILKELQPHTPKVLIHLHQIHDAMPDLTIVPAHDSRAWSRLPMLQPANPGGAPETPK